MNPKANPVVDVGVSLRVDLTSGASIRQPLTFDRIGRLLGGRGLNVGYLFRHLPAGTDPLAADNILLFSCGLLTGTPTPAASRLHINALSPLTGLIGIPLMPFLHSDLRHLLSNTVPLTVLLLLLAGSNTKSPAIVLSIVLSGGTLLWLFGRPMIHVGASGLIYGLIAFLIVTGFLERRIIPVVISIVVGFLYGGTLVWGIIPGVQSHVSWDGHLLGAVAGGLVAGFVSRNSD